MYRIILITFIVACSTPKLTPAVVYKDSETFSRENNPLILAGSDRTRSALPNERTDTILIPIDDHSNTDRSDHVDQDSTVAPTTKNKKKFYNNTRTSIKSRPHLTDQSITYRHTTPPQDRPGDLSTPLPDPTKAIKIIAGVALAGSMWAFIAPTFYSGGAELMTVVMAETMADYIITPNRSFTPTILHQVLVSDIGHTLEADISAIPGQTSISRAKMYQYQFDVDSTRWAMLPAHSQYVFPPNQFINAKARLNIYLNLVTNSNSIIVTLQNVEYRSGLIELYSLIDIRDSLLEQGYQMLMIHHRSMILKELQEVRMLILSRYKNAMLPYWQTTLARGEGDPLTIIGGAIEDAQRTGGSTAELLIVKKILVKLLYGDEGDIVRGVVANRDSRIVN